MMMAVEWMMSERESGTCAVIVFENTLKTGLWMFTGGFSGIGAVGRLDNLIFKIH